MESNSLLQPFSCQSPKNKPKNKNRTRVQQGTTGYNRDKGTGKPGYRERIRPSWSAWCASSSCVVHVVCMILRSDLSIGLFLFLGSMHMHSNHCHLTVSRMYLLYFLVSITRSTFLSLPSLPSLPSCHSCDSDHLASPWLCTLTYISTLYHSLCVSIPIVPSLHSNTVNTANIPAIPPKYLFVSAPHPFSIPLCAHIHNICIYGVAL